MQMAGFFFLLVKEMQMAGFKIRNSPHLVYMSLTLDYLIQKINKIRDQFEKYSLSII